MGLGHLGVAGAPVDRDRRGDRPPAGDPGVEAGRLGAQAGVGRDAVSDRGATAGAARLLVGHRAEDDVAAQAHADTPQALESDHQGGDAALHVVHAAAVQAPVAGGGDERVARPLLAGLDVDRVDVAVQEQAAAAAGPRQRGRELRPADEVEVVGHEAVALAGRFGFPQIDGRAERREASGEQRLQGGFVARRVARLAGGGVEGDEPGDEIAQLVTPRPHLGDDLLFEGRAFGAHAASLCSWSPGGAAPAPPRPATVAGCGPGGFYQPAVGLL